MSTLRFAEDTEPITPATGKVVVYVDSADSHVKQKDDGGTVIDLTEGSGINVKEADGSPDVSNVKTLVVSNGTLTDDGGGQVTVSTGGGGGGSIPTWTLQGGISNVGANNTKLISIGHNAAVAPFVMFKNGRVIGMSISMTAARTAGTCQLQVVKAGVAQTGSGQILDIDGVNTITNFIVFGTPITYTAGQTIGAQTVTTSFNPTGADATIVLFCEDV